MVNPYAALAARYKALGNPKRLRLLHLLALNGEAAVLSLAKALRMSMQACSGDLQVLLKVGMVVKRRSGTRCYYKLATTQRQAAQAVAEFGKDDE
jgi:DNA-binding transcriptional ArsR family regulator